MVRKMTLIFGDCIEEMEKLPKDSIDMVLTDPPYGTTACKWDTVIPFGLMWEQLKRVTKKNGAIVLFGSQPFTSALIMSNPKMFKYEWIWGKDKPTNFALANKQPMKYHENILVFYMKQCLYNKQLVPRIGSGKDRYKTGVDHSNRKMQGLPSDKSLKNAISFYDKDLKNPSSLLDYNTGRRQDLIHPTQKPVALMEYLIKTYTNKGEMVLDFTMGSGSTAIACKNLKRRFIGIDNGHCEKDKIINNIQIKGLSWVEITKLRLANFNRPALL